MKKNSDINNLALNGITKAFTEIPMDNIVKKFYKNELEIEDVLRNDDCLNDLIKNKNSKFKKIITIENIKKLIGFCLFSDEPQNENSKLQLRFPYYSCQILCSQCVLLFDESIENIKSTMKKSSELSLSNKNNDSLSSGIGDEENDKLSNYTSNDEIEKIQINTNVEDIYDEINASRELENNDIYEEKYVDIFNDQIHNNTIKKLTYKRSSVEFEQQDKELIYEILDELFKFLDLDNSKINDTCMGYFQKMVNYLLSNEEDIIFDYFFKNSIINKLIKFINNISIKNILEYILNKLSNNTLYNDDIKRIKYKDILKDLWRELIKDDKYEKAEYICELITNTLIINSDKELTEIIFENKSSMKNVTKLIKKVIDIKNNSKLIISLIKMLCKLNLVIINSFKESDLFDSIYLNNEFKSSLNIVRINSNSVESLCDKNVSIINIFESFSKNILNFFEIINDIFNLIKEDIKKRWKTIKGENNNININGMGLKYLYEWKFIFSSLKLYIYCFYAINDNIMESYFIKRKKKYFSDNEFYSILFNCYFNYRYNNIFQSDFIEIIKLICSEKCPGYLTNHFLYIIDGPNEGNNYIDLLIESLKSENKRKNKENNLLRGADFEILKLFFCSKNKNVIEYFYNNSLEREFKKLFMNILHDKWETNLTEDHLYSNYEIFNDELDNDDTFDGKDCDEKKYVKSFQKMIEYCLKEYEDKKMEYNIGNNSPYSIEREKEFFLEE